MLRILLLVAGGVPVMVLAGAFYFEKWRRRVSGARLPITEKLLRPAGYSLSQEIEKQGDDLVPWLFGSYVAAMAAVGSWGLAPTRGSGDYLTLAVCGVGAGTCAAVVWRKAQKIRMLRLGLLGEQAMGELLQGLARDGYQVFHDVPGDGKWNIDHVVVGPGGVFAIETKAKTKQPGRAGEAAHRASFDGRVIRFPRYADEKAVEQAVRNARWLSGMLSKATGERVNVGGIVALPGWMVDVLSKDGEVKVLSGKQVPGYIRGVGVKLSEKTIQQVAYQLDQRCRDVAF